MKLKPMVETFINLGSDDSFRSFGKWLFGSTVTNDNYDTSSSSSDSSSSDYSTTSSTGGPVSLVISYSGEWSGAVS